MVKRSTVMDVVKGKMINQEFRLITLNMMMIHNKLILEQQNKINVSIEMIYLVFYNSVIRLF
jgi:hypothetical protein